jgi:hypothetical protein
MVMSVPPFGSHLLRFLKALMKLPAHWSTGPPSLSVRQAAMFGKRISVRNRVTSRSGLIPLSSRRNSFSIRRSCGGGTKRRTIT